MGILSYGSDFTVNNDELDLELDKLLPLLVSVDEENAPALVEDFLKYLDGVEENSVPETVEPAAVEPEREDEEISSVTEIERAPQKP